MENSAEKRILEEFDEIESNPFDDFTCRWFRRSLFPEWHFAIRGASGTEFEGGIYHGRILFPDEYPSKPPSFMFLTENGRFKTQTKIGLNWQPSWRVRNVLPGLIDLMPTYPDGELGSVEYNKEERRALAIKSRAAAPKYGTAERQKVIDEIHEYMLSKAPPVPQLQPSSPSQASREHEHSQKDGAKRKHGTGGGSVGNNNVIGNIFLAANSNGVGVLDSINEYSGEGPNPKKPKRFWFC